MTLKRVLANICSENPERSRDFYVALLDLEIGYDSDWYVHLHCPTNASLELGIISRRHELVPTAYRKAPTGMYITFVVLDVDAVYARAKALDLEIVQEPRNEFYGQRRFLTIDPDGSSLIFARRGMGPEAEYANDLLQPRRPCHSSPFASAVGA